MLKSDAYGLGAEPIAEALVAAGCSLFFVADLDAALALRGAFPKRDDRGAGWLRPAARVRL